MYRRLCGCWCREGYGERGLRCTGVYVGVVVAAGWLSDNSSNSTVSINSSINWLNIDIFYSAFSDQFFN